MPRPRKYKDASDRYRAFLDRHPNYQQQYREDNLDRLTEYKKDWYEKNSSDCPRCSLCGARLKSERTRVDGICRSCRRKKS